jgi:hypothetical protein
MIEIDLERLICDVIDDASQDTTGRVVCQFLSSALHKQGLRFVSGLRNSYLEPDAAPVPALRRFKPGDMIVSSCGRYVTISSVGAAAYECCGGDGLYIPFEYEDQWTVVKPEYLEEGGQ